MGALRSLRGRVALVATAAVALVLIAVGTTAVATFSDRELARVDEGLAERPARAFARAFAGLPGGPDPPVPADEALRGDPPGDGPLDDGPLDDGPPGQGPAGVPGAFGPPEFRPQGEYIRLVDPSGRVLRDVDAPAGLPAPGEPGLRTLEAGGDSYRSLAREIPGGGLLELGIDLAPTEERVDELRNRLLLLGLLGVLLVGGLSWWLAGLALGPLRSLRAAAGRVSSTRDLSTRLPDESPPGEVAELTESINAMLARLERSAAETDQALQATRRFAGDAGHELRTPMTALRADIGALRRNPGLDADQRRAILEHADHEAGRATRLLDMLQTLARGDAGAALPREELDLSSLAEGAVEAARSRHPAIDWRLDAPEGELALRGWPDGLRTLLDNLLENAARHGSPGGTVQASIERADGRLVLTVDDDGPGVDPAERERVFERFARGEAGRNGGEAGGNGGLGLGLALVRQQARLHGGDASVGDSPLGGARFRVELAA